MLINDLSCRISVVAIHPILAVPLSRQESQSHEVGQSVAHRLLRAYVADCLTYLRGVGIFQVHHSFECFVHVTGQRAFTRPAAALAFDRYLLWFHREISWWRPSA